MVDFVRKTWHDTMTTHLVVGDDDDLEVLGPLVSVLKRQLYGRQGDRNRQVDRDPRRGTLQRTRVGGLQAGLRTRGIEEGVYKAGARRCLL